MKWLLPSVAVWLVACGTKSAPPLPKVDTAAFEPAVKAEVERALEAAAAAPSDAAKANDLGVVLHAHEQYGGATAAYRRALALEDNASTHYLLGIVLAADGKYADAVEPFRKALQTQPSVQPIQMRLADALLAAGDTEGARSQYTKVIERDAQAAAAYYGLGRTGVDPVANFRKALELFPRYGAAQFALANAYRREGKTAEADAVLKNYERDKTFIPPLNDAALDQVLDRSVSSTGLIRRAQLLDARGDIVGALKLHEQVVATNPKLDQAWVNLISLYARTGQPAKVDEAYRRAVALAPNRTDLYYNYGVFCVGAERWADAEKAFAQALKIDPRNAQAAHNLGAVTERTGDLAKAAALFRRAIEIEPAYRQAHFHLGRIYANQQRYAEAIAELERSIEPFDAESPTYLYALAATHARARHKQQAYELMQKARAGAMQFNQQPLVASIDRDLQTITR
jgi:tetratricopeptide (TPR) repeat protein